MYRHPKVDVTDFSNNFLNNLLKKINQKQKKEFLLGDFNVTTTISSHLPHLLISPKTFANPPSNKSNIFEREWSKVD